MQKIFPSLWFDHQAEEAANFYISVFKNSKMGTITRYGPAGPGPEGSVLTVTFQLDGQDFMAINGGPVFQFNEAISLYVNCENQAEVDELWARLTADGGEESMCGWLKDKYGVSWQIVPTELDRMINDPDPEKVRRVTEGMLQMRKLDLDVLRRAYASQS